MATVALDDTTYSAEQFGTQATQSMPLSGLTRSVLAFHELMRYVKVFCKSRPAYL